MRSYQILVKGKVQGVSYRFSAHAKAIQLGLTGFVKNLPQGDVYIEAEGKEEKINDFIKWCHVGPPLADVSEVIATETELKGYRTFELRR
jgi:acylphosphatase